jgi:hypothetical protein
MSASPRSRGRGTKARAWSFKLKRYRGKEVLGHVPFVRLSRDTNKRVAVCIFRLVWGTRLFSAALKLFFVFESRTGRQEDGVVST